MAGPHDLSETIRSLLIEREVAELFGVARSTVYRAMHRAEAQASPTARENAATRGTTSRPARRARARPSHAVVTEAF